MIQQLVQDITPRVLQFIGREKARAYLQCIYCKVKQWIQRELSHTIKSRRACVWNIWWLILILLCSLKTYLPFETWKHFLESIGYLIHLFFSRRASKYPLFQISRTLVHFFSTPFFLFSFFMNNFCIAQASSLQQNF